MSEFEAWYVNGFFALLLSLVSIAGGVALIIFGSYKGTVMESGLSMLRRLIAYGSDLDTERRAAMINNLMVAIISDQAATPVISTGSLYT
jgi:hypothetical protein